MSAWWLVAGFVIVALIPPKYDPAIRIKEWLMKDKDKW